VRKKFQDRQGLPAPFFKKISLKNKFFSYARSNLDSNSSLVAKLLFISIFLIKEHNALNTYNMKIQKTARITGLLYLLLAPLGYFGIGYVPTLIVSGNVSATINNIATHEILIRLSIVSAFLEQLVNIFVALFLYKILKPVNKTMASIMVILLFLGVPIALLNEVNQFAVLFLVNSADKSLSLVSLFLNLHQSGIFIAQIFWGLWLFPMGYLVYNSGFLPRIIGIFLILGCFGYLIDSFAFFLFPHLNLAVSHYTFIGELFIALWLLIKGVNVKKWEKRTA
jgi:uncharacterized protein DUF4386